MTSNEAKWWPGEERASRFASFKASIGLVGGTAMSRTIVACKLRRLGISVEAELRERKRAKAYSATKAASLRVLDLSDINDQEELCFLLDGRFILVSKVSKHG